MQETGSVHAGDGNVRVGCHKQGRPEVCEREDGEGRPTVYTFDDLSRKFGWDGYREYGDTRHAADGYDEEFDFPGWHFRFRGDDTGGTPRHGATMIRDGETRECDYDCKLADLIDPEGGDDMEYVRSI